MEKKFSCVIVGGGTLPIRCAEILIERGHEIRAVASSDEELKKWAANQNTEHFSPAENLAENLAAVKPFDFLFSIVNQHILSEESIRLPRRFAVNYHDAPLPKYAGTHATSWAILNGETEHGVTWHVISATVDAGDILQQRRVEIDAQETALTLNTKCYEAAVGAFEHLVENLAAENFAAEKQNLANRTFFPRFKRPPRGGVIDWSETAERISARRRALDFGRHPNPLGTAKIFAGNDFYIVRELEIVGDRSLAPPGTITKIKKDFLQIATADRDVRIGALASLDNREIAVSAFASHLGLTAGERLPKLAGVTARRLETVYSAAARHENFWVEKLRALEPAAPPFADHTTETAAANNGYASVPVCLSPKTTTFLQNQAAQIERGGDWLVAGFAVLLARLGSADEFDIGFSDTAMRDEISGFENFFAAQIPLRLEIDCRKKFAEIVRDVERQIAGAQSRKFYARDVFARRARLRLAAKNEDQFSLPVAIEKVANIDDDAAPRDAALVFVAAETAAQCRFVFDSGRLTKETVERLAEHLTILLEAAAENPEKEAALLPLISSDERRKLLYEWNDTRREYPKNLCVHQFFEAQAARTPDAVALIAGEKQLTYRELNERANRLAHHLQKLGVAPETLTGICLERSPELIVGLLAILKSGGAYLPLDPKYPRQRLAYMLEDSRAAVLLTRRGLIADFNAPETKIVCFERDAATIARESAENPTPTATQNNLAYVIYTSGSTGKPKGVALEHRSVAAFIDWATAVFSAEQLKGVLGSTSVCFDLSVFEIFATLAAGGAIILVENVLELPTAPAAEKVTLINTVPSAMPELVRVKGIPASARTVVLCGEPLKTAVVKQIYEAKSVERVYDLYGPTEDTIYSTCTVRDPVGAAHIGRPIFNTQTYILDRFMQPVPIGTAGELYLGGDGLARGYLHRPELTAERFVANPFSEKSSARLYRTGDLTRYRADGNIEYLGRIDNQVKIRGFRIELGEIEAVLLAHASVGETAVVARDGENGEKQLVAYVVRRENQSSAPSELRRFLKRSLPDYMIPSAFVALGEMPRTPNGKLDRKALPAPPSTIAGDERECVAYRDALEQRLVEIWEKTLNVQPVGVADDFFQLGGHSLQAVRMFAEVEKTFNKNIPLATLFQAGTIEKLAAILRQDGWTEAESSLVPIQPRGAKPIFFCVHAKGGNVLFYRDLARRLGDDQPFYGIQARRLGGRQLGHETIEEMAEFYIGEIQTVQPDGPYYLGGSSFGGLAAFEMARRLSARGHEIGLLALLDTGTPNYPRPLPGTSRARRKFYALVRRVQLLRDNLKSLDARGKYAYAAEKLSKIKLKYRRKIRDNYKKAARRVYRNFQGETAIPPAFIQLEDQLRRAGLNYQPGVYPGKITLFRAETQPLGIIEDETLGWKDFAGGELEIHDVPGHHGSIVAEPFVSILAEKLGGCLKEVRAEKRLATEKNAPLKNRKRATAAEAATAKSFSTSV